MEQTTPVIKMNITPRQIEILTYWKNFAERYPYTYGRLAIWNTSADSDESGRIDATDVYALVKLGYAWVKPDNHSGFGDDQFYLLQAGREFQEPQLANLPTPIVVTLPMYAGWTGLVVTDNPQGCPEGSSWVRITPPNNPEAIGVLHVLRDDQFTRIDPYAVVPAVEEKPSDDEFRAMTRVLAGMFVSFARDGVVLTPEEAIEKFAEEPAVAPVQEPAKVESTPESRKELARNTIREIVAGGDVPDNVTIREDSALRSTSYAIMIDGFKLTFSHYKKSGIIRFHLETNLNPLYPVGTPIRVVYGNYGGMTGTYVKMHEYIGGSSVVNISLGDNPKFNRTVLNSEIRPMEPAEK